MPSDRLGSLKVVRLADRGRNGKALVFAFAAVNLLSLGCSRGGDVEAINPGGHAADRDVLMPIDRQQLEVKEDANIDVRGGEWIESVAGRDLAKAVWSDDGKWIDIVSLNASCVYEIVGVRIQPIDRHDLSAGVRVAILGPIFSAGGVSLAERTGGTQNENVHWRISGSVSASGLDMTRSGTILHFYITARGPDECLPEQLCGTVVLP